MRIPYWYIFDFWRSRKFSKWCLWQTYWIADWTHIAYFQTRQWFTSILVLLKWSIEEFTKWHFSQWTDLWKICHNIIFNGLWQITTRSIYWIKDNPQTNHIFWNPSNQNQKFSIYRNLLCLRFTLQNFCEFKNVFIFC